MEPGGQTKIYPVNEFVPITDMLKGWPSLNYYTVLKWCRTGTYRHAKKVGGTWFIHPEQFRSWFEAI